MMRIIEGTLHHGNEPLPAFGVPQSKLSQPLQFSTDHSCFENSSKPRGSGNAQLSPFVGLLRSYPQSVATDLLIENPAVSRLDSSSDPFLE